MATPNKTTLTVAFNVPEIESHIRKAELVELPTGYAFIRYTGDKSPIELTPETFTNLLTLVLPFEAEIDPIKKRFTKWHEPELDTKKLLKFINSWGVVGVNNQTNLTKLHLSNTNFAIAHALGYPTGSPKESTKLLGKDFAKRAEQIRQGNEVPLPWIKAELRTLAFCARLTNNLFRDDNYEDDFVREEIILNQSNRKRIIATSPIYAIQDFKDNQDPAQFNSKQGLGNLDQAEEVLAQFAGNLNRYLQPLSMGAILTDKVEDYYRKNVGFETAFASMIANLFRSGGSLLICQECQVPYFPRRVRENAKWCGETCNRRVRDRNYKKRKKALRLEKTKISATKAGKRNAKPKYGKEKKSGKTK